MPSNRKHGSREQPAAHPHEPGSAGHTPSAHVKECNNRLVQIDCKIDWLGEKKQAQIDVVYGDTVKGALDKARDSLKDLNRLLVRVKQWPNESNREHGRRLKKENMTLEDYNQALNTWQATRARAEALDALFQEELHKLEVIEKELSVLRKQRQKAVWDIRNLEHPQQENQGKGQQG